MNLSHKDTDSHWIFHYKRRKWKKKEKKKTTEREETFRKWNEKNPSKELKFECWLIDNQSIDRQIDMKDL